MSVAPVPKSSGARQPLEESTATAGELGGGERLASTADGSATVPGVTVETARSLGAEARSTDAAPASRAGKPIVPEEQTALPEASTGVVGHAVRPWSPPVVPPAASEEYEVEEIERQESRPQAV